MTNFKLLNILEENYMGRTDGMREDAVFENDSADGLPIDASQAENLSNVLASFGIDPDVVIKTNGVDDMDGVEDFGLLESDPVPNPDDPNAPKLSDIPKPKKSSTTKKAPRKEFKVDIDKGTIEAAKKFFEIGKIGENWYYDANRTIEEGFTNEQDRVLFALLLASTSVQNEIYTNFVEAAALFNSIKADMRDNTELLQKFASDTETSVTDPQLLSHPEYSKLNMLSGAKKIKMTSISAKFGNIKRILPLLLQGKLSKDLVRNAIANSVNLDSSKGFDKRDPLIRKLKIANYALTLIDPSFASTDKNWFNVVVDTWMFRIFYPEHANNKEVISKLFSNERAYANVTRVVSDLAAQAGVSPHVMQAALWTGIKKTWEGDTADVSNYVSAIKRMVDEYGDFWKDMQVETAKLGEVIARLDTDMAASIIGNKYAERGKQLGAMTAARHAARKKAKADAAMASAVSSGIDNKKV